MTPTLAAILAYTAGCITGALVMAVALAAYERIQSQIDADTRRTLIDGAAEQALDEDAEVGTL